MDVLRSVLLFLSALALCCVAVPAHGKDDNPPEVESPEDVKPGKTGLVTAPKGMRYFLRVPKKYDAKKGARLIVFCHGSNMNGMQYVGSFEAQNWAEDAILVCPNGETGGDPFGANNFTFSSGPLVADLTEQVQKAFKTTITYIGGHSQGGFLTYSVIMNFPDLYQGAIPMAGDCWSQNEPNLWADDEKALSKQREIAIAVIHGRADPVVQFSQGQHAYDVFRAMGYPKLRLFAPEHLGHQFMLSPVDEALAWLDAMNGRESKDSLKLIKDWQKDDEWGWVREACEALRKEEPNDTAVKGGTSKALSAADKAAGEAADEMKDALKGEPSTWIPLWLEFWRKHGQSGAGKALVKKYEKQREKEQREATQLFRQALGQFRSSQRPAGLETLEKLLVEAPHTYEGYFAWRWLEDEKEEQAK